MINDNERIDDLCLDGLKIIQKLDGYAFTSDSVLLANFVKTKKNDKCVEIGVGSGIISILVNYKEQPQQIIGFEIQEKYAELATKNVQFNSMNNITIVSDRVQNFQKYLDAGTVDVVFCNPPYFKYDSSVCGNAEERVVSRFDKELSLNDLFECSSKMLKYGGKMFFINDAQRLNECFCTMKKFNLSPKRMYFVHPNQNKNATVFLCECIKGGKDGLIVLPTLFANNLDGDYIQTIQKLYKEKK